MAIIRPLIFILLSFSAKLSVVLYFYTSVRLIVDMKWKRIGRINIEDWYKILLWKIDVISPRVSYSPCISQLRGRIIALWKVKTHNKIVH
jgi:hypothetical protein